MPDDPTPPRHGAFRRPSLTKALLKVAGANLLSPVASDYADELATRTMDDFAEQGGDPGAHATLFGLAGAGGAVAPELAVMAAGGAAAKAIGTAGKEARFLASVGKEAPDFARAASPIEYLRPTLGESFTPSLRAQAALARGAREAGQAARPTSKLAASLLALLSASDR